MRIVKGGIDEYSIAVFSSRRGSNWRCFVQIEITISDLLVRQLIRDVNVLFFFRMATQQIRIAVALKGFWRRITAPWNRYNSMVLPTLHPLSITLPGKHRLPFCCQWDGRARRYVCGVLLPKQAVKQFENWLSFWHIIFAECMKIAYWNLEEP